jgi:3-oxoacyl-[acyl-carrier protein] reductase
MERQPPGDGVNSMFSSTTLAGKRALVTGARKGIGRGIALCLARAGCSAVAIVDIVDDEATQEVVTLINESGSSGSAIIADLSTVAAIREPLAATPPPP